jgi:glycosyltransferase involved in cell wall biosynthesis
MLRQKNAGVAVARQRGVERARGEIVVFVDDDILVPPDFLERHLEAHAERRDRVVMGELLPDARLAEMPLFERYHAAQLEKAAERHATQGTFAGPDVYTGNLSLPRELFLRVGGFDPTFHLEDTEIGVRLEEAGAKFVFSRAASAVHASDHTSLDAWLARSCKDGRDWVRLLRKHPGVPGANPWRFLDAANPLSRPFFVAAMVAPRSIPTLSRLVFRGASIAGALGLDRATISAMTLLYGIQYFGGVRAETGSVLDTVDAYRTYKSSLA